MKNIASDHLMRIGFDKIEFYNVHVENLDPTK